MRKSELGQSLIEVLVALAAAVAVISAIAITVITSLQNVEYTKNQNLATQYANEGLEIVKRIGRSNWQTLRSYNTQFYCLDKGSTIPVAKVGSCPANSSVWIYTREITIQLDNACGNDDGKGNLNKVKVASVVSWSDSKCGSSKPFCHQVALYTCLANINTTQAP